MKNRILIPLVVLSFVFLFGALGCAPNAPTMATSDSPQRFTVNSYIPVDTKVYTLTVQVLPAYVGKYTVAPAVSTTVSFDGKSLLRAKLLAGVAPDIQKGDSIILKVTDTKILAVLPDDQITLICRREFEALAAVLNNQEFQGDGGWEYDFCRMARPVTSEAG